MFSAGVGVGFSKMLESESVLKKWGIGVDFLNLNNLWDGVGILKNLPTPQPCFYQRSFEPVITPSDALILLWLLLSKYFIEKCLAKCRM